MRHPVTQKDPKGGHRMIKAAALDFRDDNAMTLGRHGPSILPCPWPRCR